MALAPSSSGLVAAAQNALASGWQSLMGMFSTPDFSPEAALAETPGIDPRFLPRVPMHAANIDMSVLAKLGTMGLKHGKEITAQTHPELYHVWSAMSARAGLKRVPQLILAEIAIVNRPAILVPLPTSQGGHQTQNAKVLSDAGKALLVIEGAGLCERLQAALQTLLEPEAYQAMLNRPKVSKPQDAATVIAKESLKLLEITHS